MENNSVLDEVRAQHIREMQASNYMGERARYMCEAFKESVAECISRIYMKSLIVENASQYEDTLKPVAIQTIKDALSEATTISAVETMLENASPCVKSACEVSREVVKRLDPIIAMNSKGDYLIESAGEFVIMNQEGMRIGHVEAGHDNPARIKFENNMIVNETPSIADLKPIPTTAILDNRAKMIIDAWEKDIGSDEYGTAIAQRVAKVLEKENDIATKAQEKMVKVADALTGIEQNKIEDPNADVDTGAIIDQNNTQPVQTATENPAANAVAESISVTNKGPKSLFNAIFINKSRAIINESASSDIGQYQNAVLTETICTYTLLECIHSLGIKTYSENERYKLIFDFVTA